MGTAVEDACQGLLRELASAAAQAYGASSDEWSAANGTVERPGERHSYADVVRAAHITAERPRGPIPEWADVEGPSKDTLSSHGANVRGEMRENEYGAHDH